MAALEKNIDDPYGDSTLFWRLMELHCHWPAAKDAPGAVLRLLLQGWKSRAAWVAGKHPKESRELFIREPSADWIALMGNGKNPPSQAAVLAWLKIQTVPAPTQENPNATVPGEFVGAVDAAE
jgi:hypothetical protein